MNPAWKIASVLGLAAWCAPGAHATSYYARPELPVSSVETGMWATPVTGRKLVVPVTTDVDENGRALQKAIDDAQYGDAVIVRPGVTYRMGSFELRKKLGSGWITIESSAMDVALPEGRRVSPADAKSMPRLISPGWNAPVILSEPGAHNYRLIGLDITNSDRSVVIQELVVIDAQFDVDESDIQDRSEFPHDIIIDRCYIHGLPKTDMKRDVRLHCFSCAVVNSYLSEAHVIGQDAQAIMFGGRNIKIDNNYLEGAGENLFAADYFSLRTSAPIGIPTLTSAKLSVTRDLEVGMGMSFWDGVHNLYTTVRSIAGDTVTYDALAEIPSPNAIAYWGLVPTDVEVSHNYLAKRPEWNPSDPSYAGYRPLVKNLIELKSGRRIWLHDNVLEHSWPDGQAGYAVLFTVKNQYDKCYFCAVEDITFENNIIEDVTFGMDLLATDYAAPSGPTRRVLVRNNLWRNIHDALQVDTIDQLIVDHNTALIGTFAEDVEGGVVRYDHVFTNNIIVSTCCSGWHLSSPDPPDWRSVFPGWMLQANILSRINNYSPYTDMAPSIIAQNYQVDDPDQVGFADWTHQDLTLASDSMAKGKATDGTDIGADVKTLLAEAGDVRVGGWNSPAPTSHEPQLQDLRIFWIDPANLPDPNRPTTIVAGPESSAGRADLVWDAPTAQRVEIHIGSPSGPLFASGGSKGSAVTGAWVIDGTTFYLLDCSNSASVNSSSTLAVMTVHVISGSFPEPASRGASNFHLDPATIVAPNDPTTIAAVRGSTLSIAHLIWNVPSVEEVEIHVGSPSGPLFAIGLSSGTATTGLWVKDGTTFYLQDGDSLDSSGTLSVLTIHVVQKTQIAQLANPVTFYLDPNTVDASQPTTIAAQPGSALGRVRLMWAAPGAETVEVRIGAPSGALFAAGGYTGIASTGLWVSDGMTFFLQDRSNNKALTESNTLAKLTVHVVREASVRQTIGLASFYLLPSTLPDPDKPTSVGVETSGALGSTVIGWNAPSVSCTQIRIGSPTGPLFVQAGTRGIAITGAWINEGMIFYLQDCSSSGNPTLATLTTHLAVLH
jgi:hypothetical protein